MNSNMSIANTVIVFISAVLILLCWKMLLPNYFDAKLGLENLKSELRQDKEKLDSIQKAKSDLDGVSTIKDKIFVAFSKDSDTPNAISELEAIAIKNNLVIPSIDISQKTQEPSSDGSWSKIKIAFSVSGDFAQMSSFMAALEKSIKFMDIRTLNIGSSPDGKYSLALQLDAYSVSAPAVENTEALE